MTDAVGTVQTGRIRSVNGPVVEVVGLVGVAMFDVIAIGAEGLAGEIVGIEGDVATAQVYEYDGGLAPGDPVTSHGEPLSITLGPGLLGGVFDGILRPLVADVPWLAAGRAPEADGVTWDFVPAATVGAHLEAGAILGHVVEGAHFEHRILVPPEVSGTVTWLAAGGSLGADSTIARLDGVEVRMSQRWPVRRPRPARSRDREARLLRTGQRVLDLLYPILRGSTASVPGGFGTGKTLLQQQIAKWCDAEVIVYVGCGERGNEMIDVLDDLARLEDPRTGGPLRERTVCIANTSNMPVMAREASIYTGVAVAEYFRDMGYDVVVIADSTSRWAEALREFASRTNQLPAEEGYPATLASALAAFYERAGSFTSLGGRTGSVTIIGAVSPPGGDLTEPVTAQTRRFVRAVWSLDRDLAYARHYPAVSWNESFTRDSDGVAMLRTDARDGEWAQRRALALALLAEAQRLESLVELVGAAALPDGQRVTLRSARLLREAVLQQDAMSEHDSYCGEAKQQALLAMVLDIHERMVELVASGVSAETIETFDLADVAAARGNSGPDDVDAVIATRDAALARLKTLG
ncbi:MAG: V-type ATP synthase subunit A [Candidatus Dormiibacterota bacterium]